MTHFSLIVVNDHIPEYSDPPEEGRVKCPKERIFEYTDDDMEAKYKGHWNPSHWNSLKGMLCIITNEISPPSSKPRVSLIAKIKGVTNLKSKEVKIIYEPLHPLDNKRFWENTDLMTALQIEDFEKHRNHWAIKPVDLLETLKRKAVIDEGTAKKIRGREGQKPANDAERSQSIKKHVTYLAENPQLTNLQACAAAEALEEIKRIYLNEIKRNDFPEELENLLNILRAIEEQTSTQDQPQIAELEKRIEELERQVVQFKENESAWKTFKQSLADNAGKELAKFPRYTLIAGVAYLGRADITDIIIKILG